MGDDGGIYWPKSIMHFSSLNGQKIYIREDCVSKTHFTLEEIKPVLTTLQQSYDMIVCQLGFSSPEARHIFIAIADFKSLQEKKV